jgi:hypothetical protein
VGNLIPATARQPAEGVAGPCFYCDDLEGPFVRDHFVPLWMLVKIRRQVEHDPDALARWFRLRAQARVVACVRCDVAKGRLPPLKWLRICPRPGRQRVRGLLEEIAWIPFLPGPLAVDGPGLEPAGVRSLREHAPMYLARRDGVTEES